MNGLKVKFTNLTINGIIFSWDFGDPLATPSNTSNLQTPLEVTYNQEGIYDVRLTATNSDGESVFMYTVVVRASPSLGLTILEMVLGELPAGLPINLLLYNSVVTRWKLFLQKSQNISDADVLNELKWSELVRVLIAKLVLYDIILVAAKNQISSTTVINRSVDSSPIQQAILLSDYLTTINFALPITVTSIYINNVPVPGPATIFTTSVDLLVWLNSLNKGVFSLDLSGNIISLNNFYALLKLIYRVQGAGADSQVFFTQSNQRLSTNLSAAPTGIATTGFTGKGPIKRVETGPSNAEWFDPSLFWNHILKNGGLIDFIRSEICMIAIKVGIRLYICPYIKKTKVFITGHKLKKYCR